MPAAALTFLTAFLLISTAGFLVSYRQGARRRLSRAIAVAPEINVLRDAPSPSTRVTRVVESFQSLMPRSEEEVSVIQTRLARAGYREKKTVNLFYGSKVLAPAMLCLGAALGGIYAIAGFFPFLMFAGFGFLLPDFWLGHRIKVRQTNLRLGLPDALDLIVVCVEAGLGLDRAIMRTAEELQVSQPAIADEFALVSLAQRAGRPRADALKALGDRTGVESVRSLASILIQADKFGTSIGKALRQHAEALRTRRRLDAEEQAAKTTVKLIFPLVLFIFPALFVVTLGPSMLVIIEQMKSLVE
jgi:tight adherence protein C